MRIMRIAAELGQAELLPDGASFVTWLRCEPEHILPFLELDAPAPAPTPDPVEVRWQHDITDRANNHEERIQFLEDGCPTPIAP